MTYVDIAAKTATASRFSADILGRALAAVAHFRPEPVAAPRSALVIAAALCRRFEGFYAKPYLCSAGVPSVGYGATFYEDGTRVTLSDPPISRERAETLLLWHLRQVFLPAVRRLCPEADTPERIGALLDFTYNLGAGALSSSTLRKRVNAGRWDDVPTELRRWVYARGRVLRGLVLRREAEAMLI